VARFSGGRASMVISTSEHVQASSGDE